MTAAWRPWKKALAKSTRPSMLKIQISGMASGDRGQLAQLYPVVRNITGYLANAIDPKTGLVSNLPGGGGDYAGGMVDWPPQMRYGYDMSTTARTTLNIVAVDDFRRVAAMTRLRTLARERRLVRRSCSASRASVIYTLFMGCTRCSTS